MPKAEVDELRTQIRRNRLNVEHMEHKEKIKARERAEAEQREARIAQLKDRARRDAAADEAVVSGKVNPFAEEEKKEEE